MGKNLVYLKRVVQPLPDIAVAAMPKRAQMIHHKEGRLVERD